MDKKNMVKKQFDLQADKFSNWTITQNTAYMKQYFEFCEINKEDTLLDIACGTGEYAIYCAQRIKNVCGVDLSEKMIGIAKKKAHAFRLGNISFCTQDVAELSFGNGRFSVVNSKSTFHHFTDYQKIMLEIKRCCERGGKISIQDIIAYKNSNIDDYFEKLENLIDISHNKTLSREFFIRLFSDNDIQILRSHIVTIELKLQDYINHAVQTNERQNEIYNLIDYGLKNKKLANYFVQKAGRWYFSRNVFLMLGSPFK